MQQVGLLQPVEAQNVSLQIKTEGKIKTLLLSFLKMYFPNIFIEGNYRTLK
jgi:hypothetical protein